MFGVADGAVRTSKFFNAVFCERLVSRSRFSAELDLPALLLTVVFVVVAFAAFAGALLDDDEDEKLPKPVLVLLVLPILLFALLLLLLRWEENPDLKLREEPPEDRAPDDPDVLALAISNIGIHKATVVIPTTKLWIILFAIDFMCRSVVK